MRIRYRNRQGFTIVELLIVVVVIGILAAIVIVAYNGITTQAENTKTVQGVAQYVRGLQIYVTQNGHYPIEDGYPCLGPHPGTSCGRITNGSSDYCLGSGTTVSGADFDTEMKTVFNGNVPVLSTQQMSCGTVKAHGAYYLPNDSNGGSTARIYYFLKGNQPCNGVGGVDTFVKNQLDDTTQCRITLPAAS